MNESVIDIRKINRLLDEFDLGCLKKENYTLSDIDFIEFIFRNSYLLDKENMQLFNNGCLKMAASIIDDCDKWFGRYIKFNSAIDFVDKIKYDELKDFDDSDRERLIFLNMLSNEIKKEILIFTYNSDDFLSKMFFDITKLINKVVDKTKLERFNYPNTDKFSAYLDVRFANPFFGKCDYKKKIKSI